MRRTALGFALMGSGLIAACDSNGPQGVHDDPYVTGSIESIMHRATASGLLVRPAAGARDPCGISATVDAQTRYYRRRVRSLEPAALADLQLGDTVEVHVTGPVAESCPAQGYASAIVIVSTSQ